MPTAPPALPPAADDAMVECIGLSRRHGAFRLALAEANCTIRRGEFALIRGGNGAGKTTLLRLIAALEPATSGRLWVAGLEPARLRPRARAQFRRSLGIVPQELLLLDDRSVLANVMLPALVAGRGRREAAQRALAALERVGLTAADAGRQFPAMLGSGDRQRVALARALVNRPALLLADEPTASLDAAEAARVAALLTAFAAGGVTVIVATRDPRPLWPAGARPRELIDGRLTEAAAPANPVAERAA